MIEPTDKNSKDKNSSEKPEAPKSPFVYIMIGGFLIVVFKFYIFDSRTPFQDRIYNFLNPSAARVEVQDTEAQDNLAQMLRGGRDGAQSYDLYKDIEDGFLAVDLPAPGDEVGAPKVDAHHHEHEHVELDTEEEVEEAPPVVAQEETAHDDHEHAHHDTHNDHGHDHDDEEVTILSQADDLGAGWQEKAQISIIIDDVGVARKSSLASIEQLPKEVTLAILPYADDILNWAHWALRHEHELMLHVPMEPMNGKMDLGPIALRTQMGEQEFKANLRQILDVFKGYKGINNHMGSRLTQDTKRMGWVMEALKWRDLYFIDSKTIHNSVAADVARDNGIPYAERHVFLDHEDSEAFIRGALKNLEAVALANGSAIAIGHPKPKTIAALKAWIPTLKDKGIRLVPASALVKQPSVPAMPVAESLQPDAVFSDQLLD